MDQQFDIYNQDNTNRRSTNTPLKHFVPPLGQTGQQNMNYQDNQRGQTQSFTVQGQTYNEEKPQWMRFFDDQMIKTGTTQGEYSQNQPLIHDQEDQQMNNDEIPAIVQTQQVLDPNVQLFEVKCNPELNFAYIDTKNKIDQKSNQAPPDEVESKEEPAPKKKVKGQCCTESAYMKILTVIILILIVIICVIISKIIQIQSLLNQEFTNSKSLKTEEIQELIQAKELELNEQIDNSESDVNTKLQEQNGQSTTNLSGLQTQVDDLKSSDQSEASTTTASTAELVDEYYLDIYKIIIDECASSNHFIVDAENGSGPMMYECLNHMYA